MDQTPLSQPAKRPPAWLFGVFFGGIAGLFILIGSGMAVSQANTLRQLVQGEATVVRRTTVVQIGPEAQVEAGGDNTVAEVSLRFQAAGKEHLVPAPFDIDAMDIGPHGLDTHPGLRDGMTVTIWYEPEQPENVRLLRTPDFFPYLFILFPMIHLTVGLAVSLFAGGGLTPLSKARRIGLLALVWNGVGGACLWHILSLGGRLDLVAGGAFAAYGAVGLILLAVWVRFARAAAAAQPVITDEPSGPLPDR